jgi:hypothetical protein
MEITRDEVLKIKGANFIDLEIVNEDKDKACEFLRERIVEVYPHILK